MSAIIAFDPNILIGASNEDPECQRAINHLQSLISDFCLGFDKEERKIFQEFALTIQTTGLHPSTTQFLKHYFYTLSTMESAGRWAPVNTDDSVIKGSLEKNGCDQSIEKELLTVGVNAPKEKYVLVTGKPLNFNGVHSRGTDIPGKIDCLENEIFGLEVWTVGTIVADLSRYERFSRGRFPNNLEHLRLFIKGKSESETIEYKQPTGDNLKSILRAAMESVCAMLNTSGGKVIIGVRDDGELTGFEYPHSEDRLGNELTNRLSSIKPTANRCVKLYLISIGNGRYAAVYHVECSARGPHKFGGTEYHRVYAADRREWQDEA